MLKVPVSDGTDLEHFLCLQLTFRFLPTKVLSDDVHQATADLVELLMYYLHVFPRGLQRGQDSDGGLIWSHQDKWHCILSLVQDPYFVHPEGSKKKKRNSDILQFLGCFWVHFSNMAHNPAQLKSHHVRVRPLHTSLCSLSVNFCNTPVVSFWKRLIRGSPTGCTVPTIK